MVKLKKIRRPNAIGLIRRGDPNKRKKEILKYLKKDSSKVSTNNISKNVGISYPYCVKYLEQLRKEGLINKYQETRSVYWRTKK